MGRVKTNGAVGFVVEVNNALKFNEEKSHG